MRPAFSKYFVNYPFYFLTGQPLLSYQRQFEQTQWLPYQELQAIQWNHFKQMLSYAYTVIPFYKEFFDKHGVEPKAIKTKEDSLKIPVLTKEHINNNFENLTSHAKGLRKFSRQTSGSSGSPLSLVKDSTSLAVMDAIMYRNYGWFGVDTGCRQARYWGSAFDGVGRLKAKVRDFLLNRIRFSPFDVSDKACDEFLGKLRKFNPEYVYGYSQTIFRFSEYVIRNGLDLSDLKLKVVILTGEMISPEQLECIQAAFKCQISNEYGCTEVGIISMECPCKGMHLMIENLFIEFIKDGKHALPGEEGEIIVTELYGKAMPLIRYKVGDIGSFDNKICQCGRELPLLGRLKGRNDEFIICPDGKQVDPIIFEYVLKEIPSKHGKITQFRIIQKTPSRLDIELFYDGTEMEVMLEKIEKKLKKVIGKEFVINFLPLDFIPTERSGKLRCFISHLER